MERCDDILGALKRLDRLLTRAVRVASDRYGPEAAADPFRGLHVSESELGRLLHQEPAAPSLWTGTLATEDFPSDSRRLGWLADSFELSSFDLDVILIALAPELDLRYERVYSFLQNDVTRRRPTVSLALDLLCASTTDKLAFRERFAPDAPLLRHAMIELVADSHQTAPPLLAHYLVLDGQIVRLLLAEDTIDPRLASWCTRATPSARLDDLPLGAQVKGYLRAFAADARQAGTPAHLYLRGTFAADNRRAAEALAAEVGCPLLAADLERLPPGFEAAERMLRLVFREAWFRDAVLYLENFDALRSSDRQNLGRSLLERLAESRGITLLSGSFEWMPAGVTPVPVITLPVTVPGYAERLHQWHVGMADAGIDVDEALLKAVAGRFRLSASAIAQAAALAREQARWRNGPMDLFAAARTQCRHDLATLARKIEPRYTWADIVLPEDTVAQLREICEREARRYRVLDEWGFDGKLSMGKGVSALFAGPSGTGKTMAAEIIANELGLDLYRIDLAGVVSKYIGETEKNLDRIFSAAENAILLFDEADALFGKRSEVRDSHDRYANVEISYLLQKMEQYDGVTILTTNLRQNLDDAFIRRLAFTVHFPFPDELQRRHIWSRIWPGALPLSPDVDLDVLAARFKLSGGNIKNVALAAAFLAASDGQVVTMNHLRRAIQREFQKLGKTLSAADLNGAAATNRGVKDCVVAVDGVM